jgi:two-component system OmpR family sensor kinase
VNFHSLRFKLIWIHGTAIALVIVCIGLIRYQIISYRSYKHFDENLRRDGQLFVSRFRFNQSGLALSINGLSAGDSESLQELARYFILTDLQGRILRKDLHSKYIQSMLDRGDLPAMLSQNAGFGNATAEDGAAYRFVHLPMPPGMIPQAAIMHIGRSMEPFHGILREYLVLYLYSVPLILAISAAVGWYLAGRALKPFEEITQTAERITFENLDAQIFTVHKEKEIQRLVQSFNAMVVRLNESFQQMRKFNADAAHELRTPLTILQGETEVALRSPNLPEEIRTLLTSNLEELERLTRLVNDMLTMAEAEAGQQVFVKEPADLKALLEDLVDQMRLMAADRNLEINLGGVRALWVEVDKLWIRRAIINLLDNAIKYSTEGGRIDISVWGEGLMARLEIQDYGIGISRDDLPFIFNRLYRTDPARGRNSGGVGLGLALVKWIIEAHMGTIQVSSEPDIGTCFVVTLPAKSGISNSESGLHTP